MIYTVDKVLTVFEKEVFTHAEDKAFTFNVDRELISYEDKLLTSGDKVFTPTEDKVLTSTEDQVLTTVNDISLYSGDLNNGMILWEMIYIPIGVTIFLVLIIIMMAALLIIKSRRIDSFGGRNAYFNDQLSYAALTSAIGRIDDQYRVYYSQVNFVTIYIYICLIKYISIFLYML